MLVKGAPCIRVFHTGVTVSNANKPSWFIIMGIWHFRRFSLDLVCCFRIKWSNDVSCEIQYTRWRHQMETFSALLAPCEGNSQVTGEFPSLRPMTRSFDVFFDLRLNKRSTGCPAVREKSGKFQTWQKSGNFVEGQGKNEYWEKSGNLHLVQSK